MPSASTVSNQPITLLLIEDNPADIRLMQELLPNYQLDVAARLADGLASLARHQPDVILLDLYLPDSEGIETIRRLRAEVPGVAIVVITRFEVEDLGIQAIHEGAQDYVVKGQIDSRTLQRVLRYAMERHQSDTALRANEVQFRAMFEQSAVGMAFVDLDGRFRLVNERLCDMVGYHRQELLDMTFGDITHADDVAEDWANANRLLAGEQADYTVEKRYVRKDGRIVWATLTGTLVRTASGDPNYFLAVVQDITARKQAEQAQTYLAAIVESSEDSITGQALDGTIISWNAAAERIYGWTADEAIGQSIALLFPPGLEEEYHHILATVRQGDTIARLETRRVRKDGQPVEIALSVAPITNAAGTVIGASIIERDITMLKWAQAARQESEQRLRQLTDNVEEVLWLRDAETGQILYVNAAFTRVWGIPRERLYEQPYAYVEYIHPADRDRIVETIQQHPYSESEDEYRILRPDGAERWIRARRSPIYDEAGAVYRTAGIAEDITDYKRLMLAEQKQRALAEALRDIANALNSTFDMDEILDRLLTHIGRVVRHDAVEIMLIEGDRAHIVRSRGYASRGLQEELEALDFVLAETPNLKYMLHYRAPLIVSDVYAEQEDTNFKKSPALFWRSYAGVPIVTEGEVTGFINLGSLTPHFFTPLHADRLQAFAEQVSLAIRNARLHAQTRDLAAHHERQRLARDLHDAVSQTLFATAMTAEALVTQYERDPSRIGPSLERLHRLARGALAETRTVLLELRPESLAEIELDTLLEQLVAAVQSRKQLDVLLDLAPVGELDPDLKLVLYRIAQEALNNIVKHAQATEVTIRLCRDGARLTLAIRDDGVGFDRAELPATSMGLGIMRERAEGAGVSLAINSAVGEGTQIVVACEVC